MEPTETPEKLVMEPRFLERVVKKTDHARCVDGRLDTNLPTEKGPQMLGGSLHPAIVSILSNNEKLSAETIARKVQSLKDKGFGIGVHEDDHPHTEGACGCGFADNFLQIFRTAKEQKTEILSRMMGLLGESETLEAVRNAFVLFDKYDEVNIRETGAKIVHSCEECGAARELLEGDHQEKVAFVNLKEGTTFDTNRANGEGWQAFNFDLWAAQEQAEALGVDSASATGLSLILYQATEIVLVEQKEKPRLDVVVRS